MGGRLAARAGALMVIAGGRRRRHAVAASLAALALLLIAAVGGAGGASGAGIPIYGVDVFPIPGGQVASPQTQITFRSVAPSELTGITVVGSHSGAHTGHFAFDSDGRGGSFIPDAPFSPGETVTVLTSLPIYGTKGSEPGGFGNSWSFKVATPAGGFPSLHWPPAPRVPGDVQGFRSRPDLQPVSISVTRSGAYGSGDIFLAPQWGPLQDGPMILDSHGRLVWFDRLKGNDSAADFRVQTYKGQPVLTWWQGHLDAGVGVGEDVIFDRSYRQIAVVQAGNGLNADLHEFQITPHNTALVVAEYPVYWDSHAVKGGSTHQIVLDSVVQEIDIPTGLVLFQWDALDHVPLTDTYQPPPKSVRSPFDPYHVNSVQVDDDGNLLISLRNTWAAYKVSHANGWVQWALGGRNSSFKLAPGTYWAFQHDVRVRASGDRYITIFDDDAGPPIIHGESRAIKIALDLGHHTAKQVVSHTHAPSLLANYEGNYQQLPNGDDFVGWGQQPYFTEYDTHGRIAFDAHMAGLNASYRVWRFPWSAVPWNLPAVAASNSGHGTTVWMSWNGATGVVWWRVLGGPNPSALHPLATVGRSGFETQAGVARSGYVRVQALDSAHRVLGTSAPIAVH